MKKLKKNNLLLIKDSFKFCSSKEHASTNLSVPIVFHKDTMHASISPKCGLRASLQVQFECDLDKGVLPPNKPTCEIIPMCHDT